MAGIGKYKKGVSFTLKSGNTPDKESLFKYKSPVKDVTIVEPQSTEGFVDTDVMENVGELEGKGAAGDSLGLQVLQQLDAPKKEKKEDEECEAQECGEGMTWSTTTCSCEKTGPQNGENEEEEDPVDEDIEGSGSPTKYKRSGFKMRSGNKTTFKMMGAPGSDDEAVESHIASLQNKRDFSQYKN